jgi:hypothetical protein
LTTVPATVINRAKALARFDTSANLRQPRAAAVVTATLLSVGLSLAADALLVVIGISIFPSTKGYAHFRFGDYSKLTVIGVLVACAAWPFVTRMTAAPRWVFSRLAVLVTIVLLLPDLYIWFRGQPGRAVIVLMAMHLAIAAVSYNTLVHIAPVARDHPRRASR